ncbi:MAG: sulfide/dihydroorotate dehydrogenase-like FAD/NAD-binding protein [Coriobacteriia bacterium]|nr:sulfide/dihydroorotate dehydrogenase-like FAD/NAD-binding protein [Coriobacteriia bacterium]
MYQVLSKRQLSDAVFELTVEAPRIARKCAAGQFLIVRADEHGERVPFTFSDWSAEEGWVRFIFARVGKTTHLLSRLATHDTIADVSGPLGRPTKILGKGKHMAIVGGGVGTAVAYPVARAACAAGARVSVITGARSADLLILQDELRALPLGRLLITTDDGSAGTQGLVTGPLAELCMNDDVDEVFIVGPAVMMKFAAQTALEAGVPTMVSLNPLMVDGTGMCGACRVTINGRTQFGCVDGPDFDAAGVDWEELMTRQTTYNEQERLADAKYAHEVLHEVEARLAKLEAQQEGSCSCKAE